MPMLQLREIPVHHAGTMTAYLLHNSEKFFPPLNGACTVTNLILTITAYLNRNESSLAASKLPWLGASLALNFATTAWALGIMVPMNKAMARHAGSLEKNNADEKSEKELRRLQARWQKLNYGMSRFEVEVLVRLFSADFWFSFRSCCDHDRFFDHCSVRSARGWSRSQDLKVLWWID
jgi:hypothetical protein